MRFLYVTDFHGHRQSYEAAAEAALRHGVSLVVNGGDMLPKLGDEDLIQNERLFFGWLRPHLRSLKDRGVAYSAMFGNDDCGVLLPELDRLSEEGLLERLDRGWLEHRGWHFIGFPWVPDTPFLLKDWSLLDSTGWEVPRQFGPALISTPRGFEEVGMPAQAYLSQVESIRKKLARPPYSTPPDPARSVFVMHAPPSGSKLDLCWDGRAVGSDAGRDFIVRMKFPLSLHGHIHEAPGSNGGTWATRVGGTIAVNPGAGGGPCWVLVDTEARTLRHASRGEAKF
ncbi:MAG: metallophosphoesterase [Deltaproteobacteria bacterium]|nr:metallophosphoesterase [Deltaproteobacteria bacterium]